MGYRATVAAAFIACAIALLMLLMLVTGSPPLGGVRALVNGSIGSWYAFTSSTLVRSVPLLLAGGGVAIAFRAGVFNIGAEGQLLVGASAAAALGLWLPHGGWITTTLALVAGALAGAFWAGIAAYLRERFAVLEVISTIMLNFVALYGISYLVRGPLQEPTHAYPQSSAVAESVRLSHLPWAGRLHTGFVLALALLIFAGWVMRHTAIGFRMLAVGENPFAAASAGQIDVPLSVRHAFLASGGLAGLAGAVEVFGVTYSLYEDLSPGYGYSAIAVALLAGLDPWRVIPAALLFGALESGGAAMQRDVGIPATLVTVVEASLILVLLLLRNRLGRRASARVLEQAAT